MSFFMHWLYEIECASERAREKESEWDFSVCGKRKSTNISFDWKPGHLNANGEFFSLFLHLLTIWEFSLIISNVKAYAIAPYRAAACLLASQPLLPLPLILLLLSLNDAISPGSKTESNDLFSKPKTTDFCWLVLSTLLHRTRRARCSCCHHLAVFPQQSANLEVCVSTHSQSQNTHTCVFVSYTFFTSPTVECQRLKGTRGRSALLSILFYYKQRNR